MKAENVSFFASGKSLLRNAHVRVEPRKLTLLLGCNGAGKSTLLRILAGTLSPRSGEVSARGKPLREFPPQKRAETIGYLPQGLSTPFAFTVEEIVQLGANKTTISIVCEALEIEALRGRTLTTLSGGERQRAALARVLSTPARTLLLDEPTAHLDLRHALRLLHALRERALGGDAILLATHDLALCLPFANHVLILTEGELTFDAPTSELTPEILERCLGIEAQLLPEGALSGYLKFS